MFDNLEIKTGVVYVKNEEKTVSGDAYVIAGLGAVVHASGNAQVLANSGSKVYAKDNVVVVASDGSYVEARGESNVMVENSATIFAYDATKVIGAGWANSKLNPTSVVKTFELATCISFSKSNVELFEASVFEKRF